VLKVAKRVGEALAVAAGAGLRHGSLEPACIRRDGGGRGASGGRGAKRRARNGRPSERRE
jgi:hypothetical protein